MSLYVVKIISTLIHLILIFSISSISVTSLGRYSFFIALASIFSQICMFEGAQHVIARKLKLKLFYSYYLLNTILWGLFIALIYNLVKNDALALIFISIFMLNSTSEKLINIFTIQDRLNKDDKSYRKFHNVKNIVFEIIIPLIFIIFIEHFKVLSQFSILFLSICWLFIIFIILFIVKMKAKPRLMQTSFFSGIVFKKIDGLFIRLFTGYFWGFTALGGIQPAMSVARSINILTPLWINLNLNSFFSSHINKSSLKAFIWIPVTYIFYIFISIVALRLLQFFSIDEFTQITLTLAFIWFGNANTKAIIRAISVFNGLLVTNNSSLVISLIFKFLLSFLIPVGDFYKLFIFLIIIDFIHIGIFIYILLTKAAKNVEHK